MSDTTGNASCGECRRASCPARAVMHETFDAIRRREIERHAGDFDAADRADLDALTRRMMQRVLDVPLARLPGVPQRSSESPCPGKLVRRLFTPPADEPARCECDSSQQKER